MENQKYEEMNALAIDMLRSLAVSEAAMRRQRCQVC